MKVAVFSAHRFEIPFLEQADDANQLQLIAEPLSLASACKAKGCEAVSLFVSDDACAAVLESLASLGVKYVALRSAGFNNVDLDAARRLQMKVARVANYSPHAVAEHTVAMMLALNRHLIEAHGRIRKHNFCLDGLMGFDMHEKTVGIIGTGRIGAQVARILSGFGCHVLGCDPVVDENLREQYHVEYVDVEALLHRSDIITLHAPLNEHTKMLINSDAIGKMKRNVMLINTGRGAMVDTAAVIAGLDSGKIGYVGLDVYEHENGLFFEDHSAEILEDELFLQLIERSNVLVTSHQGFLTDAALRDIAESTAENLECFKNNTTSPNSLLPAYG